MSRPARLPESGDRSGAASPVPVLLALYITHRKQLFDAFVRIPSILRLDIFDTGTPGVVDLPGIGVDHIGIIRRVAFGGILGR